jgi:hypothetical protein
MLLGDSRTSKKRTSFSPSRSGTKGAPVAMPPAFANEESLRAMPSQPGYVTTAESAVSARGRAIVIVRARHLPHG